MRNPAASGNEAPRCLICEAWALGDLCPEHQSLVDMEVPERLVKRSPPKGEQGHWSPPDFLWTVVLFLFILVLLRYLGAI